MRTTIRLNDKLLADAKQFALAKGKTLTALVEDALREVMGRKTSESRTGFVSLPTSKGGTGIVAGVDIDDSVSLLDVLDEDKIHKLYKKHK